MSKHTHKLPAPNRSLRIKVRFLLTQTQAAWRVGNLRRVGWLQRQLLALTDATALEV